MKEEENEEEAQGGDNVLGGMVETGEVASSNRPSREGGLGWCGANEYIKEPIHLICRVLITIRQQIPFLFHASNLPHASPDLFNSILTRLCLYISFPSLIFTLSSLTFSLTPFLNAIFFSFFSRAFRLLVYCRVYYRGSSEFLWRA